MERDIRGTDLYREIEALYKDIRQPGTGQFSDALEVNASPDGRHAVFAGVMHDALEGTPPTRICLTDLATGDTRVLTFGPNVDRLPKFSPDGVSIAFLSDRHRKDDFQLYLLDPKTGGARPAPRVEGWIEYLHWSPDGKRILLGVAGHGADIAGGQGAVTSKQAAQNLPSWTPALDTGDERYRWRRAWVYELATDRVRQVSRGPDNVWEAVWCGNDTFAAVVSPAPGEGHWYSARLQIAAIKGSGLAAETRQIYKPKDQLGWPAGSPSGNTLAVVEAVCSDRWFVAGDLKLIDTRSCEVRRVDTRGVDITFTEWRSDTQLLLVGHRGFETVVGLCDAHSGEFTVIWESRELAAGDRFISVSGFNEPGDCVLVGESFLRAPEIAVIRGGTYQPVKSSDLGYLDQVKTLVNVECVIWRAADGLEIQGWLLRPSKRGPYPVVMNVHGGPVWHWRPTWLGRPRTIPMLMLLKRGYGVFLPNPRGSSARGQDFSRLVVGEMGGADAYDCLSGLDHLVAQRVADPGRLGLMGISYGGFMTSWLITQDSRFSAAISVAPHTNQVTAHLLSNIPQFVKLFLQDDYNNAGGKYFGRSPVMHAHKVRTPTLNICGALDRCTPPEEAAQFHSALLENGTESVLVTYPEEGHGVRKFPAAIDYAARVVSWFEEHMRATVAVPPR